MRPYKISLAAGGAQDVPAAGSYVYAIATPGGPVTVHAYDVNGALVLEGSLHAGRGMLCPPFVRLHIENGATAQLIEIQAGFGQVQDVGLVSVAGVVETAPDFSRALAGTAFLGGVISGPVAGQYSMVQIINPAGNKDVVINRISLRGAQYVGLRRGPAAQGAILRPFANALIGAADSPAGFWYGAAAAIPAGTDILSVEASATVELPLEVPVVLPPATAITIFGATANVSVTVNAEMFEV